MTRVAPRDRWAEFFKAFTERNASRLTILEIDHPDVGAQPQKIDYPLRGIAYDRRDDRVQMMFGDLARAEPHLTHTIEGVTEVEIEVGPSGEDRVLRIGHEGGQTLLRLLPV